MKKLNIIQVKWLIVSLIALMMADDCISQTPFSPGNQIASYTDTRVRGYFFTAQSSFNICEVYVPNTMNSNMWHVEIVRFTNSAPPAFPGTTNAFTSLFYADSVTGNNSISCNVAVTTGDIIGIYGSRSNSNSAANVMANSYDSPNFVTSIQGNNTTLRRSGMQFPLNNQQMHDIWSEVNSNTGRIIGFHTCCPIPPKPQGPFNMPSPICAGDTVTFWIPYDTIAQDYNWTVPAGDTIISGQGDTLITVAIGQFSNGGQICVELEDSCMWSGDTCFNYVVNQPPSPVVISGPDQVCQGDSAWYTIPDSNFYTDYLWTVTNATVLQELDTAVLLGFNVGAMKLCVQVKDSCAWSDTTCLDITGAAAPSPANAGPDRLVCSADSANLAATVPAVGTGTWTIASGGTGTFSNASNPSAWFYPSSAGTYILRWTVTSAGCPETSDEMSVTVNQSPTADFVANDVCEGTAVGFTDQSNANGGTINFWSWDMDQDNVVDHSTANPIHTYSSVGLFTVRLIVANQGCADTVFHNVSVDPLPDVSIAGEDVCFHFQTDFENNSSVSIGSLSSAVWDFGDGSPTLNTNGSVAPSHVYTNPGIYTVTSTIETDAGCVASDQVTVTVYHLPKADYTIYNACQFQTSEFNDASTVTNADIAQWKWNLGAGLDTIYAQNITHDYTTNGIVPVYLQVRSSFGCYDDTIGYTEIFPTPETHFNFENKVCLGSILNLESVSELSYGSITNYQWIIADSILYNTAKPSHLFDKVGEYKVFLKTTSNHGCQSSIEKYVPVFDVPKVEFIYDNVCSKSEYRFKDATVSEEAMKLYKWDFGDSTMLSYDRNPVHVFDTHGVYTVNLYVESFKDCSSEVSHQVKAHELLNPRFDVVSDSGCSPLQVEFVETTESLTGVSWKREWDFGDGSEISTDETHVYRNYTGKHNEFTVTLHVVSENDCESSYSVDSVVYVVPQPKAEFTSTPEDLEALTTIKPFAQFADLSRDANYYLWDFGDETYSREENPAHEWAEPGNYEVKLVTRNIYECVDSISHPVLIVHANLPFIPSAFTPNQDGNNEVFTVSGLEQIADMKMEIFDRWGKILHEESGLNASWDGYNPQGILVSNGVYGYRITYELLTGEIIKKEGSLTVLSVD